MGYKCAHRYSGTALATVFDHQSTHDTTHSGQTHHRPMATLTLLHLHKHAKKITAEEEQCFVQILPQTTELSALSFRSTNISLPVARLSHTVKKILLKILLKIQQRKRYQL